MVAPLVPFFEGKMDCPYNFVELNLFFCPIKVFKSLGHNYHLREIVPAHNLFMKFMDLGEIVFIDFTFDHQLFECLK